MAFFAGTGFVYLLSLFAAADLGRSLSCFLPVALAGMVLLHRTSAPQWALKWLPGLVLLNLLLPAWHVVTTFRMPIYYLYAELADWQTVPEYLTSGYYNRQGVGFLEANQGEQALMMFSTALKLDPGNAAARFNRASALVRLGDFRSALQETNQVIEQGIEEPDAYFLRGVCHETLGHLEAARADYQAALNKAPPDWPSRAEVAKRLAQLQMP